MHISYIIWCRNSKFGVLIPLGMAEWCIPFWVTLTLTLTSGLISSFFLSGAYLLYYSSLSSNVSYARPIPLGAFHTCLWHFLLLFMFGVCHAFLSVHCSLVVTSWERANLLALFCVMFYCVFVTFPYGGLSQVWYLIVSISDLCLLTYFHILIPTAKTTELIISLKHW